MADADRSNLRPLSLHIPEPKFRPGDAVDFAAKSRSYRQADAARRPDTATPANEFHELSLTGLVRVLDDDGSRGRASGTRASPPEMLRRMLRNMALVRAFDERMFRAQRQGKTSFYMKSTGRGGGGGRRRRMALAADDMAFPSAIGSRGILITRGYPLVDDDEPDLLQQR